MSQNLALRKITALVLCLCKLHNICIDENDKAKEVAGDDDLNIVGSGGLSMHDNGRNGIIDLLDAGNFATDHDRMLQESQVSLSSPADAMLKIITEEGYE